MFSKESSILLSQTQSLAIIQSSEDIEDTSSFRGAVQSTTAALAQPPSLPIGKTRSSSSSSSLSSSSNSTLEEASCSHEGFRTESSPICFALASCRLRFKFGNNEF